MMAHRMTMAVPMSASMSATMAALGQGRTGECEAGCKDQRRGERKFLHHVLHWGERTCPFKSMNDG
ncbi:hypothetical protein XI07_14740 [Bradyrhizobium sp. CCBAU 11445]|nr:hypothetical protein [Bradyrhizobium sp. CCBAU 25360]MDA9483258.1 hypothetical protein [Bradyrhizobium sp. CCBAU 11445]